MSRHDSGEAVVEETSFPTETETMKRMSAKVLLDSFYTLLPQDFNSLDLHFIGFHFVSTFEILENQYKIKVNQRKV